ncbi:hypothetical protein ACA910_016918 [Epithemia clementina (nom. ined.)]
MSVSQHQYASAGSTATSNSASTAENDNKEQMEDCRDYLRTGRCKYGASCKYNHPPNVQSGGGMKSPLNPTEPMFPVRPNEPICQYFLKHGTCKFGQACKFHHPPSAAQQPHYATSSSGASPVLLSVAPGRKVVEQATQLVAVGPPGVDLTHFTVQFLPQRPEEPDCIYFLKNGRCKYGATCRYHHPIHSYSSQPTSSRQSRHPRSNEIYASSASKRIPYATQQSGSGSAHPPRHIVVASEIGGPVSFIGLDQVPSQATYQPVTFLSSQGELISTQGPHGTVNGGSFLFSGSTAMTEQGSSASSIASSFDTASSNMDFVANEAAALWSRARKNGSGGSLNAFDKSRGTVNHLPSSSSDGNIAMRAHSLSVGGAGDFYAAYTDSSPHSSGALGARSAEWRNRSMSMDRQTKRSGGYGNETATDSQGNVVGLHHGRPPIPSRSGRQRQSRGNGDEGFTMMTSALLNMLDTQEETSAEAYSEEESSFVAGTSFPRLDEDRCLYGSDSGQYDVTASAMMENLTLHSSSRLGNPDEVSVYSEFAMAEQRNTAAHWSQTCNGGLRMMHAAAPRPHYSNSHQHPTATNGGPCGTQVSDLGLYFP